MIRSRYDTVDTAKLSFRLFFSLSLSCSNTQAICREQNMFYNTQIGVSKLCSGHVQFFFSCPPAGLTNQVPVWHSRAGAPLVSLVLFQLIVVVTNFQVRSWVMFLFLYQKP